MIVVMVQVWKIHSQYPSQAKIINDSTTTQICAIVVWQSKYYSSTKRKEKNNSEQMRLHVGIMLLCLMTLIWTQQTMIVAYGHLDASEANRWCCTCSSADQGNLSFAIIPANCYPSCNCSSEDSSEDKWLCYCLSTELPKVNSGNDETSCFAECDCSSGTSTESHLAKKQMSRKVLILIILLCAVLTTLAFIGLALCYFHLKDRWHIKWPFFSSDRQSSCNIATSFITQRASLKICNGSVSFTTQPIPGCLPKGSLLRRKRISAIHGVIVKFSYYELEIATNKFSDSNLIGVGGSSHVYRGFLKDGKIVAVKRMNIQEGPDAESSFLSEIELISRLHHCHVVPLLGYCLERQGKFVERLLVFEYMSNGNLRDSLDNNSKKSLDWSSRVTIALGAARGLEYLHEAAAPRILHRDVKSTNVLLDEKWRAKITDLGMAKHLYHDEIPSCSSTPRKMQGTFGYFAPEYAIVGRASLKSDVFSFGVVLLELITGRPAIWSSRSGEESLVIWASSRLQDSRRVISELPDPHLEGIFDKEEMQVMAYLAKECLLLDPDSRPTMSEVVQILSTIAPEKSKRKSMSIHVFQNSYMGSNDVKLSYPVDIEEIKHVMSDKQFDDCSLTSDISSNSSIRFQRHEEETETVPIEYEEKLNSPVSSDKIPQPRDEEAVDLTEPRFESFCVFNDDS